MVGPVSESERQAFQRKLQVGVAALVAASCGLIALQAEAALPLAGGVTVLGGVVGWGLAWFVVPSGPSPVEKQRRQRQQTNARDDHFADGDSDDDAEDTAGATNRQGALRRD